MTVKKIKIEKKSTNVYFHLIQRTMDGMVCSFSRSYSERAQKWASDHLGSVPGGGGGPRVTRRGPEETTGRRPEPPAPETTPQGRGAGITFICVYIYEIKYRFQQYSLVLVGLRSVRAYAAVSGLKHRPDDHAATHFQMTWGSTGLSHATHARSREND